MRKLGLTDERIIKSGDVRLELAIIAALSRESKKNKNMMTVEIHEEVINFLERNGSFQIDVDGTKAYFVNNIWYRSTFVPGLYVVETIDNQQ